MRFPLLILFVGLLFPQLVLAQIFSQFESGSYVLKSNQNQRHNCELKLRGNSVLMVKDSTVGKNLKLTPNEVSSFRIGQHKFIVAQNFDVPASIASGFEDQAFVELLDSGQVILMRYEFTSGSAVMMGAGGTMSPGGSTSSELYLLRWATGHEISPIPANQVTHGGPKFREALLPFFSTRPDLAKLLKEKRIILDDLPGVIHALNTNQEFTPTNWSPPSNTSNWTDLPTNYVPNTNRHSEHRPPSLR